MSLKSKIIALDLRGTLIDPPINREANAVRALNSLGYKDLPDFQIQTRAQNRYKNPSISDWILESLLTYSRDLLFENEIEVPIDHLVVAFQKMEEEYIKSSTALIQDHSLHQAISRLETQERKVVILVDGPYWREIAVMRRLFPATMQTRDEEEFIFSPITLGFNKLHIGYFVNFLKTMDMNPEELLLISDGIEKDLLTAAEIGIASIHISQKCESQICQSVIQPICHFRNIHECLNWVSEAQING